MIMRPRAEPPAPAVPPDLESPPLRAARRALIAAIEMEQEKANANANAKEKEQED